MGHGARGTEPGSTDKKAADKKAHQPAHTIYLPNGPQPICTLYPPTQATTSFLC